MKLHQEDPRLTALALGELPTEETAEVKRAIAADLALREAFVEIEEIRYCLIEALGEKKEHLQLRHREVIRRAAREVSRQGKIEYLNSHRTARQSWIAPLAAAAVIIGGIFLLTLFPETSSSGGTKLVTANTESFKSGANERGDEELKNHSRILQLPPEAAGKSLAQITSAIRSEKRMPNKDEIHIPEILNAFPLKASGSIVFWNGCKLAVEIFTSPWKPSSNLVIVEINSPKDAAQALSVEYRAEKTTVVSHHLLGYQEAHLTEDKNAVSTIKANSRIMLVIEVESLDVHLGSLHWSVEEREAPPVPLVGNPQQEPSDDARFAALVSAFGLWLRGENSGLIDETLLLRLAQELDNGNLAADRYDFLNLIDEATKLSDK